jgi:hypothetical protein
MLAGPTRAASLAVEPVDIGSPFLAATQAAAVAAIVHRGLMSSVVMRVHRSVPLAAAGATIMRRKRVRPTTAVEATTMRRKRVKPATAAVEATAAATAAVEATAATAVGRQGRPAERKRDRASHRGQGNRPHDILRFLRADHSTLGWPGGFHSRAIFVAGVFTASCAGAWVTSI